MEKASPLFEALSEANLTGEEEIQMYDIRFTVDLKRLKQSLNEDATPNKELQNPLGHDILISMEDQLDQPAVESTEPEYFSSPYDLTPVEIQDQKTRITGKLEEFEESGHHWGQVRDDRFYVKLLTPPDVFDKEFGLNDKEKKFFRKVIFKWGHDYMQNIEAFPRLRDEMNLTEEKFNEKLANISDRDNFNGHSLAELSVLFENRYPIPEATWNKAKEKLDSGTSSLDFLANLKLMDPKKFKRDDIASLIDWEKIHKEIAGTRTKIPSLYLHDAAQAKIIMANDIKYDRNHGMYLV